MLEKLNRYLTKVSIFLVAVALVAGILGCDGDGYTPPSEDLQIWDWYDLDAVRNNLAGNHILMNDLDSTTPGYQELASPTANGGKGWQSIGTFTGSFDGQGYEIRDLFINRPDEPDVGLFGLVDDGGIIKNVILVTATVTGEESMGDLVGYNVGTVSNCYSTGSVTGDGYVGGLVGMNFESRGIVSDSFWDTETSRQATSAGRMGKSTAEMKDIATFSGARWNISAVANPDIRNPSYIWNIIDNVTYPFLSWQSVS
jgi:hypothetical protein